MQNQLLPVKDKNNSPVVEEMLTSMLISGIPPFFSEATQV